MTGCSSARALSCVAIIFSWTFSAAAAEEFGYVQIKATEFAMEVVEGQRPAAGWRVQPLPDRWVTDERWQQGRIGWYRVRLEPALSELDNSELAGKPLAAYLQRLSTNAEVYVNDEFIGSGGRFTEPIARNMHRPLMFTIPRSSIVGDSNYLYVRLIVYPNFGHLTGIRVGYDVALRPTYENQYFLQVTLSQWLWLIAFLSSAFGFIFWISVERKPVNLYFSLTALCWSLYCLNLAIRDIPVPAAVWWWMIHTNLEWAAVFLVLFAHRLCDITNPWFERAMIVFAVATPVAYGFAVIEHINEVSRQLHTVTLVAMVYLWGSLMWKFYKTRSREALLLVVCLIALIVLGTNDLVRHTVPIDSPNWQTKFYLLQFGAPFMFVIIAAFIGTRYSNATKRAAQLTVAEQTTRQQERQRIYQDLHDDVGAKLLGLVYAAKDPQEADLARSALSDIRDIVSKEPHEPSSVQELLDLLAVEVRSRASSASLDVELDLDVAGSAVVSGESSYHLLRIVRELLTNTIKHAGAQSVSLAARLDAHLLQLMYADDGCGLADTVEPSTGLNGIHRRADTLGGQVRFFSPDDSAGIVCEVQVPLSSMTVP